MRLRESAWFARIMCTVIVIVSAINPDPITVALSSFACWVWGQVEALRRVQHELGIP